MKKIKENKGITLIALVITIIILLILATVSIVGVIGENGLIAKVTEAKQKETEAEIKEKIQLILSEFQVEKVNNEELQLIDYLNQEKNNGKLDNVINNFDGTIQVWLNGYEIKITESNLNMTEIKISNNIQLTYEEIASDGENIKILIKVSDNKTGIKRIKYPDGYVLECNGKNEVAIDYTIQLEKEYKFLIESESGEKDEKKIYLDIYNANSLIQYVRDNNFEGNSYARIKVNEELYSAHQISYNGDLTLDGVTNVEGATLEDNVYEFGNKADVATEKEDAKNMVILKVNGNMTINEGVTLTACKSDNGFGGPKGMMIYCTGTLTNNGTISMTARGARAEGQNVYLWKNQDGSYEYVPAIGAIGGIGFDGPYAYYSDYIYYGKNGENANERETRRRRLWWWI